MISKPYTKIAKFLQQYVPMYTSGETPKECNNNNNNNNNDDDDDDNNTSF